MSVDPPWVVDRAAGWLGVAFLVTLLGSEAALTLPDETADPATVASFYAEHRTTIIVLQLVGLVSCVVLALFAWRLRVVDRWVFVAGLILAVLAAVPGLVTLVLAVVADPAQPDRAETYNRLEPRGDDALFVGIVIFAVAVTLVRSPVWLRVVAAIVAVSCLLRLVLEVIGQPRGAVDSLAPIGFLVLVCVLTFLRFRGRRSSSDPAPARG
jgi:hypothetical protein